MRLGVVFPQLEIGTDPEVIKRYAQAVEEMGYDHLLTYDHVLGVDPATAVRPRGYTFQSMFHEPLVLFGREQDLAVELEPPDRGMLDPLAGLPADRDIVFGP